MTSVTGFRRVPPRIIGVSGVVPDRAFQAFETRDWLETTGVLVGRFDPEAQPSEVATFDGMSDKLGRHEVQERPVILVDGVVVSSGARPTRSQLAGTVGRCRREAALPAIR
jgi:hypothetical protein